MVQKIPCWTYNPISGRVICSLTPDKTHNNDLRVCENTNYRNIFQNLPTADTSDKRTKWLYPKIVRL